MTLPNSSPFGSPDDDDFSIDIPSDLGKGKFYVAEGEHEATLIDLVSAVSNAGNPMLVWTYAITGGDSAGTEMKNFTALTDAAMWKLTETFDALGVEYAPGEKVKLNPSELTGTTVTLVIEDSEYQGQVRSSIALVKSHNAADSEFNPS